MSHAEPSVNGIPAHSFICSCNNFKLDNLRYLENLYERKTS